MVTQASLPAEVQKSLSTRPTGSAGLGQGALTYRYVLGIIRRRLWLIVIVMGINTALQGARFFNIMRGLAW